MTAKLDFALMFRDEQVAEEVRKKAELGWLDVEITVSGVAYCVNDKMHYMVSTEEKEIFEYRERAILNNIYCTDVMSYTEKCSVPIGTKEDKELEVKKILAQKIKEAYTVDLFQFLNMLAEKLRDNSAQRWMQRLQNQIEGIFDEQQLRYFEIMLNYYYANLRLSSDVYQYYKKWLAEERSYMEDDFVQKDLFVKTYYGYVYADEKSSTGFKYMEDSLQEYILKKRIEFNKKGILMGAVYEKTIYYNQKKSPAQLRKEFIEDLKIVMSTNYWIDLKKTCAKKHLSENDWVTINKMNCAARETVRTYLGQWNVEMQDKYFV